MQVHQLKQYTSFLNNNTFDIALIELDMKKGLHNAKTVLSI
jgi:hypothetical protein